MDTHNMAQLGSIASRQASTLNTFVSATCHPPACALSSDGAHWCR